jgi:cytochrome c oxidase subunit 2
MGTPPIFLFQSVLNPASTESREINRLFGQYAFAAAILLIFVSTLVIYITIRFREKPGDLPPRQFSKNNRVELLMFVVPTLLILTFFMLTVRSIHRVMRPAAGRPEVIITGHQWWWEVYYPATGVRSANEIHLPVNKDLLIELHSADVIHDWWVPEFGNKMDVIPGINNHLWLNLKKPGTFEGACSEFCGAEHAWMRIKVFAEDEAAYKTWLDANNKTANLPEDQQAMSGMLLFQFKSCGSCHRISGTTAVAMVGPDLSHLFSRSTMLSGMMPMNEKNLHDWISDPQAVKPDAKMPDFIFSRDTVDAIVHYLTQLK